MQLYFEQIQLNLEQIQLLVEQKHKEVRISCIKLERRTFFGGEENFKNNSLMQLVERRTSGGEVNLGLKFTSPQFAYKNS